MPDPIRRLRPGAALSAAVLAAVLLAPAAQAQSLRGSRASMDLQNRMARQHDFTFLRTGKQVKRFVRGGYLVHVAGNADFTLHAVSFPYARPGLARFVERLAARYRRACGERLVVTSLTRPIDRQPRNASSRSVHPTGMAVDLRRSASPGCRAWLEKVLVELEAEGVLDATRERYPPHYHVALFPRPYARYVESNGDVLTRFASAPNPLEGPGVNSTEYLVRRGDSLWGIARKHGVSVDLIKLENDLSSSRIYAGQILTVPVAR